MSELITVGIAAARQAGEFLLEHLGHIQRIEEKADRNFATDVDKGAEALIIDAISGRFPDHGVIAEEGGSRNPGADYLWVIDPLDGTHNFIRGIPLFGVSLGIVYKQQFVGGIIYMPVQDELYVGEKGNGAYKNDARISVSAFTRLRECSVSYDSGIRYNPDIALPILREVADQVFNVRMLGSSARNLSLVAEGKLDAAIEFADQPWDCAGGVCIIEEAGGKIADLQGAPLTVRTVGYLASNGRVHAAFQAIIDRHPEKR
ncbi:MAG TPA: inositol monophosphatase [Candidatus Omnitrophota bacterium]|nr:inositol monophosphatase [Candidatus Omnitrophota bacterium]HRZ14552.1 inositol monophosphatase [Candidatus Omnitrophota bacterium]